MTDRPELDEAAALRYMVWVLVRQGDYAEAERIALHAAQKLDPGLLAAPDPDRVGVFGSLLFNAASAAANLLEHWLARRPGRVTTLATHYAPDRAALA